jgi:hypothetical protein
MKRKWSVKRIIALSALAILATVGILLYSNFNKIVSQAVMMSFNSNIISDVYELKFERLRVNLFKGDVRVVNVIIQRRQEPLRDYPYINSSLSLKAERITLIDVQLWQLIKSGGLILKEISISKPEIELTMSEAYPNLFPFSDSVAEKGDTKKKALELFSLSEFRLEDAAIHVVNEHRQSKTEVKKFNMTLHGLLINQKPDTNVVTLSRVDLSIADLDRTNRKGPFRHVSLNEFQIGMDSFRMRSTMDTLTWGMTDFTTGLNNLDLHTVDSLFHIKVGSFSSSYKDKQITIGNLSFSPNISQEAMQARYEYQNVQVSGKVGTMNVRGINFDSLIYHRTLSIDTIAIGTPELAVFKDKTKPIDSARTPTYFGQQISAVAIPLRINAVVVNDVQLVNTERKPDSTYAKVTLDRGNAVVSNITNTSKAAPLVIKADAYLSNKLHFNLQMDFSYTKPSFAYSGALGKFAMSDLNAVLRAYTPATITAGQADQMTFSGIADWTSAAGDMKFLYNDLEIDLALKDQAKWKSSIVAFAANTIVNTSNPSSSGLPPREVKFHVERDMHKGFVNIIMKSILNGVKETLIMSKENRAAYQAARKKQKKKDS